MKLPDGRHKGKTVSKACSLLDVGATMIDLAGAVHPNAPETDAVSLMRYLDDDKLERDVYVEYHGEGVMWPCFMLRQGDYKYTYIHQHETQLFNVITDPDERKNLSGLTEYAELETKMRTTLLARFSPEQVLDYLEISRKRRAIVREANKARGISWDYSPVFPDHLRYTRGI
jgi:choline-sulfatase